MNLRHILAGALGMAVFAAEAADAVKPSGRLPRVGLIVASAAPKPGATVLQYDGAARGLAEGGFIDGKTVVIETRYAAGRMETIPELVRQLVALRVDAMIVAGQQGQDGVRLAGGSTPAVLVACDLKETIDLSRPEGTTTGLTCVSAELAGKRLELLKETVPALGKVAIAYNPGDPNKVVEFDRMQGFARALGLTIHAYPIGKDEEFAPAFARMKREGAQALVVLADSYFIFHAARLATLATEHRLPAMFGFRPYVDAGGLMSYGANLRDAFRRAGNYAARILNGTNPRDLPFEQMSTFELIVNRRTARTLGLEFPQTVLVRADVVIE